MYAMSTCQKEDFSTYSPASAGARGYTLMEMAIVMAIVGLLLAAFLGAYNIYSRDKARSVTAENATYVLDAIDRYVKQNGHYPCPAAIDLPYDNVNYGMPTDCSDTSVSVGHAPGAGPGTGTGDYFVEESGRSGVLLDPAAVTMGTPRVRRGMVPFRVLGIPEKYAYDGYDMRYMYVVTENLAVPDMFVVDSGGIGVYRGSSTTASLVEPEFSGHFILFSAGANRLGGYNRFGQRPFACDTTYVEGQNCNTSTSAANRVARYSIAPYGTVAGANYFDDYVRFYTATQLPLWRAGSNQGLDIRDSLGAENGNLLGMGTNMPAAQLDVQGDVRAQDNILTNRVCNADGRECFTPADAATGALRCPSGEYAVGFEGGRVKCSASAEVRCPPGEYVTGIVDDGGVEGQKIVCGGKRGCPRQTVNVCYDEGTGVWERDVLDSKANGNTSTAAGGLDKVDTYTCTAGVWEKTGSTGNCACEDIATEKRFYSCDRGYYIDSTRWPVPGGRYTGSIEVDYERTCPAAATETRTGDNCVCDDSIPTEETRVLDCPDGSGKRVVQKRSWSCPGGTPWRGQWSSWMPPASCSGGGCTARSETEYFSCPVGYAADDTDPFDIMVEKHLDTSCNWSTDPPVNNCNCVGAAQARNIGCQDGAGSILQVRTFDCGTNEFDAWATIASDCTATPTPRWRANDTTQGVRFNDSSTQTRLLSSTGASVSCELANLGDKNTCYYPISGFDYWAFQCTCE